MSENTPLPVSNQTPPPLIDHSQILVPVKNRSWIKTILFSLGIFIVIIISLYFTIAHPLMVAGNPIPPLKYGDYVLVNKLQYNFTSPQKGDRIQFKSPSGQTFIGIIIETSGNKDIYETVSTPAGGRYLLKKEDILGKIYFPFISNTDSLSQTMANIATPSPIPSISTPISSESATINWKTYTNTQFGFSFKYPSQLLIEEIDYYAKDAPVVLLDDTYTVTLTDKNTNKTNQNVIMVRVFNKTVTLSDVTKHYFSSVSNDWQDIIIDGAKGKITNAIDEETRKKEGRVAYVEMNNYIYYFHISQFSEDNSIEESTFNQILSSLTFKAQLISDPVSQSAEGKACGGITGETGNNACPIGYYCKYSESYPDASGVCTQD